MLAWYTHAVRREGSCIPFGSECEYETFGDCVKANSKKRNPRAYCAQIMKATEAHCKKQRAAQHVPVLAPPVDAPPPSAMPPPVSIER